METFQDGGQQNMKSGHDYDSQQIEGSRLNSEMNNFPHSSGEGSVGSENYPKQPEGIYANQLQNYPGYNRGSFGVGDQHGGMMAGNIDYSQNAQYSGQFSHNSMRPTYQGMPRSGMPPVRAGMMPPSMGMMAGSFSSSQRMVSSQGMSQSGQTPTLNQLLQTSSSSQRYPGTYPDYPGHGKVGEPGSGTPHSMSQQSWSSSARMMGSYPQTPMMGSSYRTQGGSMAENGPQGGMSPGPPSSTSYPSASPYMNSGMAANPHRYMMGPGRPGHMAPMSSQSYTQQMPPHSMNYNPSSQSSSSQPPNLQQQQQQQMYQGPQHQPQPPGPSPSHPSPSPSPGQPTSSLRPPSSLSRGPSPKLPSPALHTATEQSSPFNAKKTEESVESAKDNVQSEEGSEASPTGGSQSHGAVSGGAARPTPSPAPSTGSRSDTPASNSGGPVGSPVPPRPPSSQGEGHSLSSPSPMATQGYNQQMMPPPGSGQLGYPGGPGSKMGAPGMPPHYAPYNSQYPQGSYRGHPGMGGVSGSGGPGSMPGYPQSMYNGPNSQMGPGGPGVYMNRGMHSYNPHYAPGASTPMNSHYGNFNSHSSHMGMGQGHGPGPGPGPGMSQPGAGSMPMSGGPMMGGHSPMNSGQSAMGITHPPHMAPGGKGAQAAAQAALAAAANSAGSRMPSRGLAASPRMMGPQGSGSPGLINHNMGNPSLAGMSSQIEQITPSNITATTKPASPGSQSSTVPDGSGNGPPVGSSSNGSGEGAGMMSPGSDTQESSSRPSSTATPGQIGDGGNGASDTAGSDSSGSMPSSDSTSVDSGFHSSADQSEKPPNESTPTHSSSPPSTLPPTSNGPCDEDASQDGEGKMMTATPTSIPTSIHTSSTTTTVSKASVSQTMTQSVASSETMSTPSAGGPVSTSMPTMMTPTPTTPQANGPRYPYPHPSMRYPMGHQGDNSMMGNSGGYYPGMQSMPPYNMGPGSMGPGNMNRGHMGAGGMSNDVPGSMSQGNMGNNVPPGSMPNSMAPGNMPNSMAQGSMPNNFQYGNMPPGNMGGNMAQGNMPPGSMPAGNMPSSMPQSGMPSGNMPPGHMPNNMPPGHMPNNMPPGHMPNNMLPGHMPNNMPPGNMPNNMPPGNMPNNMPQGSMTHGNMMNSMNHGGMPNHTSMPNCMPQGGPMGGMPPYKNSLGGDMNSHPMRNMPPGLKNSMSDDLPSQPDRKKKKANDVTRLYDLGNERERRPFLDSLLAFLEDKGTPLTTLPTVSKQPLDLFALYQGVREKGGMVEMNKARKWKEVCSAVNISTSASAATTLKKNYIRYLFAFECKMDRNGMDPTPILQELETHHKKREPKKRAPSPGSQNSQDSFQQNSNSGMMDGYPGGGGMPGYMSGPDGQMMPGGPGSMMHNNMMPHPGMMHGSGSGMMGHGGMMMNSGSGPGHTGPQGGMMMGPGMRGGPNSYMGASPGPPVSGSSNSNNTALSPVSGSGGTAVTLPPSTTPNSRPNTADSISVQDPFADEPKSSSPASFQSRPGGPSPTPGGFPSPGPPTSSGSRPSSTSNPNAASFPGSPAEQGSGGGAVRRSGDSFPASQGDGAPFTFGHESSNQSTQSYRPDNPNSSFMPRFPGQPQFQGGGHGEGYSGSHPFPGHGPGLGPRMPGQDSYGSFSPQQQGVRPSMNRDGSFPGSGREGAPWSPMHSRSYPPSSGTSGPPVGPFGRPHPRNSPHTREKVLSKLQQKSGVVMPSTPSTPFSSKKEVVFPADSVESVQPAPCKRRRLTHKDLAPVEAWRLMLALKSGLLAESTWAIDTLNILLFDDATVTYFNLQHMPGLLEVLTEHFRASLMHAFNILTHKELRARKTSCHNCPHAVKQEKEKDFAELVGTDSEASLDTELYTSNYTWVSRQDKAVATDDKFRDCAVLDSKSWDVFSGFKSGKQLWQKGCGDTTQHVVPCFESGVTHSILSRLFCPKTCRNAEGGERDKAASQGVHEQCRQCQLGAKERNVKSRLVNCASKVKKEACSSDSVIHKHSMSATSLTNHVVSGIKIEKQDALFHRCGSTDSLSPPVLPAATQEGTLCNEESGPADDRPSPGADNDENPAPDLTREDSTGETQPPLALEPESKSNNQLKTSEDNNHLKTNEDNNQPKTCEGSSQHKASEGESCPRDEELTAEIVAMMIKEQDGEMEEEAYRHDDAPLMSIQADQEEVGQRCLAISNILRSLSCIPGNEARLSQHHGLMLVVGQVLLLHHSHPPRTKAQPATPLDNQNHILHADVKTGTEGREDAQGKDSEEKMETEEKVKDEVKQEEGEEKTDRSELKTDTDVKEEKVEEEKVNSEETEEVGLEEGGEKEKDWATSPEWWWDMVEGLRENCLVVLANISSHMHMSNMHSDVCLPLLDGLLHWMVCPSSTACDPLPSAPVSQLSPQRLAMEALCKLCIDDNNVDLLLATPPFSRILILLDRLMRLLADPSQPVPREFSIVLLSRLVQADPVAARAIALQHSSIPLLMDFLESAEQSAMTAATQQRGPVSTNSADVMGTSPDMLRRAASTLLHMARVPDNRKLFLHYQNRLLALVMSQILDSDITQIISDVLFECSQSDFTPT